VTTREADLLLDAIRRTLRLPVVAAQIVRGGELVWRVEAANLPHRYVAEHPDYAEAALWLAELVGFDVMDG
jgi:hypothetical protein